MKTLCLSLCGLFATLVAWAAPGTGNQGNAGPGMADSVSQLGDFQVVELRRYTVADGERKHFAAYFDAYFPEAFEQLGSMVFGQYFDRTGPNRFTWLRGFKDINARAVVSAAFYYGPLWREHRATLNAILPDSDNVLLLRPLAVDTGVTVLPALDPVKEPDGAHGLLVAEIFAVAKGKEEAFAAQARKVLDPIRAPGIRPAGMLVTLDVPNNFPQLPIRTDGPYLVWLTLVRDEATLTGPFARQADQALQVLRETHMLRGEAERLVMDPTPRSRLRWLDKMP